MVSTQRLLATATLVLALIGITPQAHAQTVQRDFNLQTFAPAPGQNNFITVEGGGVVDGEVNGSLGFMLNYAHQSLQFNADGTITDIVRHHTTLDLMGAISFASFFELGIVLPVLLNQDGEDLIIRGVPFAGGREPTVKAGLSDPRFHLKFDLLNGFWGKVSDIVGLALVTVITAPLGDALNANQFMGNSGITVAPKLALELNFLPVRLGFNIGYRYAEDKQFYQADLGQQLTYGGAIEWSVLQNLRLLLEAYGANAFSNVSSSSPLELYGALKWAFVKDVWWTTGVGGGLPLSGDDINVGTGAPTVRVFTGIKWEPTAEKAPKLLDSDGDGFFDDVDKCITAPEDKDGFEDQDGCPDYDNDNDGYVDAVDSCPNDAEDLDGFEDRDGCPDLDNDKDGIPDSKDKCPNDAETKNGIEDDDGCPEKDTDGDGILDAVDQCPNQPEDKDGIQDEDGCPETDADADKILDPKDKCPLEPEIYNGNEDEDGCPDKGAELMRVGAQKLEILERVEFATGSAKIVGAQSFKVLDAVSGLLKGNEAIKVRVEGHTDNVGKPANNKKLSQARAESVTKYLVGKGIAKERLTAEGLGQEKPIADNNTKEGKQKNRRVEFHVVD